MSQPSELDQLRKELKKPANRCFGHEIEIHHDLRDEYIEDSEMSLFKTIREDLGKIIARVEQEIRSWDAELHVSSLCDPSFNFEDPDYREDTDEWTVIVRRNDWDSYEWRLTFHGAAFQTIVAGD